VVLHNRDLDPAPVRHRGDACSDRSEVFANLRQARPRGRGNQSGLIVIQHQSHGQPSCDPCASRDTQENILDCIQCI
jgi:hypothetical protein